MIKKRKEMDNASLETAVRAALENAPADLK